MKNSFTNKQTDLDLNGPYLSFGTQPQSVTGIGTTVGGTSGATVIMTGISTTGFNPTGTSRFNPPCIAVIDENTGSSQFSVNQDWNNFYAAHPKRQFYLMDVGGSYGDQTVKTPTGIGTGAAPITNFTKFDVNRDEGNAANTSDWFDLAGLSTLSTGSLVSLWVDSSGSMTPSNVQASLDLFLTNCSNAGLNVEQSPNPNAYFEEYIEPFITELVGDPPPENKGTVDYRWYEEGVGALSDSATVTGTASTTLTISNLRTPTDNGRQFFLQADYDPQIAVGIGSTGITGNAPNEPFNSGIATVTVTPLVQITGQPSNITVFPNISIGTTVTAGLSDTSFGDDLQFQWALDGTNASDGTITKESSSGVTVTTTVSGATLSTLTLSSDNPGIGYTAKCTVTSATSSNSTVVSDEIDYTVNSVDDFSNVRIESISSGISTATITAYDLNNGEYTFNASTSSTTTNNVFLYSIYSPDKNLSVEMDLYGGKGDNTSAFSGGEGGYSRIRFTMNQNEEYIIAGLTEGINTPFVYRKAQLIACVGEGGEGGNGGDGGAGGGIGISGGHAGGFGGSNVGAITGDGTFGSSYVSPLVYPEDSQATGRDGGQTISCTKGVYFRQEGLGSCDDITDPSLSHFRQSDGSEVTNSALITRGYKAGYNIIQTAGIEQPSNNGGKGGNGARGGQGGTSNGGGGGGSGYSDGSVTVVSATLGGSTGNGKVILRVVS